MSACVWYKKYGNLCKSCQTRFARRDAPMTLRQTSCQGGQVALYRLSNSQRKWGKPGLDWLDGGRSCAGHETTIVRVRKWVARHCDSLPQPPTPCWGIYYYHCVLSTPSSHAHCYPRSLCWLWAVRGHCHTQQCYSSFVTCRKTRRAQVSEPGAMEIYCWVDWGCTPENSLDGLVSNLNMCTCWEKRKSTRVQTWQNHKVEKTFSTWTLLFSFPALETMDPGPAERIGCAQKPQARFGCRTQDYSSWSIE